MTYGMDGLNHDNDIVRRRDVMDSMVKEYNRRFSLGERSGLRLAWIEKAVNDVPSAQPEPIKINIDHELTKDEYEKIRKDLADAPVVLLPSAQPEAIRPKFVAEDRYRKNLFQTFPHCPKCNYELETGDCYCRVCGCHIDWSEDDE